MQEEVILRRPDDWHVHLRSGGLCYTASLFTARVFARAMVMPNLTDQGMVLTAEHIRKYRAEIMQNVSILPHDFEPLMTVRLTPQTKPADIENCQQAGAVAAKLYPDGVTTGSQGGIKDIRCLDEVLSAMQDLDLVLSIHAEKPNSTIWEAEADYIPTLAKLIERFPKLRIVIEHLSDHRMVDFFVTTPETVAATVTLHHLLLTCDRVMENDRVAYPHHYCKPVAKQNEDRNALIELVLSQHPRVFFGSDSAPHPMFKKCHPQPAAGVFSSPVVLPILVEIFNRVGEYHVLDDFLSLHGAMFYRLPINAQTIKLKKAKWQVPETIDYPCGCVVPFMAGKQIGWKIMD